VTDANFDKAVSYAFEDAGRFVGSDIESVSEQMGAAITDAYLENARFVVFCDVCGRLNIQLGPSSAEYLTYLAEPGAIGSPDA
jgi:hypothetical protein